MRYTTHASTNYSGSIFLGIMRPEKGRLRKLLKRFLGREPKTGFSFCTLGTKLTTLQFV